MTRLGSIFHFSSTGLNYFQDMPDRGKTRRRSSSLSGLYDVMEFKRRESGMVCYYVRDGQLSSIF